MTEDQLAKLAQEVKDLADESRDICPTCGGTGLSEEDGFECPDCDGEGYTEI